MDSCKGELPIMYCMHPSILHKFATHTIYLSVEGIVGAHVLSFWQALCPVVSSLPNNWREDYWSSWLSSFGSKIKISSRTKIVMLMVFRLHQRSLEVLIVKFMKRVFDSNVAYGKVYNGDYVGDFIFYWVGHRYCAS